MATVYQNLASGLKMALLSLLSFSENLGVDSMSDICRIKRQNLP